jgi:hydroxymethylglutaryl-CoA lyase
MEKQVKIVECPRDAMQGLHHFIPTELKARYINALLEVGFDTIDAGSFVSPKAIPQMADTAEVLKLLKLNSSSPEILVIAANRRGGEEAAAFDEVDTIGFPFSISETFQLRNTNSTIAQSLKTVEELQSICITKNKKLVIYISMAFGNPYGDAWNADEAINWVSSIHSLGIRTISLADTVGVATPGDVTYMFSNLIPQFQDVEFGAHLHCRPDNWLPKLDAAFQSGCRRFDGALKGYGGCPMANDELTGNMATENIVEYLQNPRPINMEKFNECLHLASFVFNNVATS